MGAETFLEVEQALSLVALAGAVGAGVMDEIPVGAVLSDRWGRVLAQTGNGPIASNDPLGHAEIIAMRNACQRLANYRLVGTYMIVSLQPCSLCLEALKMARVSEVSFLAEQTRDSTSGRGGMAVVQSGQSTENRADTAKIVQASVEILRFFFARQRRI
jgi:tRNA(adenine34) deaminase